MVIIISNKVFPTYDEQSLKEVHQGGHPTAEGPSLIGFCHTFANFDRDFADGKTIPV